VDRGIDHPVECYSGVEYAERPTAFIYEGRRLPVDRIVDRWRVPGGKGFRVKTPDGQTFDLFYAELYDEWRIHPAG